TGGLSPYRAPRGRAGAARAERRATTVGAGGRRLMAEIAREYRYVVDRDGRIFHDGTEIVDPAVLRFFLRAMTRTDDGRCLVLCQGERNYFAAPDTPFVVQRLRLSLEGSALQSVELCFQGDYREARDPAVVRAGPAPVSGGLGLAVRRVVFPGRLPRAARSRHARNRA